MAWSRALPQIAKAYALDDMSLEMKSFFEKMTSTEHQVRNVARYDKVTALGVPKIRKVSENDTIALHGELGVTPASIVKYYNRIVVNGEVIHCHTYTKTKKRNNCVVILKDGHIFKISYFLSVSEDRHQLYAVGRFGNCTVQKLVVKISLSLMKTVLFPTGFERAINSNVIVRPCVYINCASNPVVCEPILTYYC